MSIVVFQFLGGSIILLTLLGIYFFHNRGDRKIKNILIVALILEIILSNIVYFNFTGTDKRIKQESTAADTIFKSKMETKQKIKEFNYKNEYKDVSTSIEKEADSIHKSVK